MKQQIKVNFKLEKDIYDLRKQITIDWAKEIDDLELIDCELRSGEKEGNNLLDIWYRIPALPFGKGSCFSLTYQITSKLQPKVTINYGSKPEVEKINVIKGVVEKSGNWGYKFVIPKEEVGNRYFRIEIPKYGTIKETYNVNLIKEKNSRFYTGQHEKGKGDLIFIIIDQGKLHEQEVKIPPFVYLTDDVKTTPSVVEETPKNPVVNTSPISQIDPLPIGSKKGTVLEVDFESTPVGTIFNGKAQKAAGIDCTWASWGMAENTKVDDSEFYTGTRSLNVRYGRAGSLPRQTQSKWRIPEKKEYYISYMVKFDENFSFKGQKWAGGKLPGLGSGNLCAGGKTCNGSNGFTARLMWREEGRAVLYLYHMDKPKKWGQDIQLKNADGSNVKFPKGKWTNVVIRVKMNTGSEKNGEITVWIDQKPVLALNNLRFATNGDLIDTGYFCTFHGGSNDEWYPPQDVFAWFDDFVISTNKKDVLPSNA